MAMKGLAGLIDIERHELDEKRKALAELQDRTDQCRAQLDLIARRIEEEGGVVGDSVQSAAAFSAFLFGAMSRRRGIEQTIVQLENDIAAARDEVVEAFRQVKKLETVREREMDKEALLQRRRDQAVSDEVGLTMHRAKTTGSD